MLAKSWLFLVLSALLPCTLQASLVPSHYRGRRQQLLQDIVRFKFSH